MRSDQTVNECFPCTISSLDSLLQSCHTTLYVSPLLAPNLLVLARNSLPTRSVPGCGDLDPFECGPHFGEASRASFKSIRKELCLLPTRGTSFRESILLLDVPVTVPPKIAVAAPFKYQAATIIVVRISLQRES